MAEKREKNGQKRAKILKIVFDIFFLLLVVGGLVGLILDVGLRLAPNLTDSEKLSYGWSAAAAGLVILLFPLETVLHESGHLICGLLAGLRPVRVTVRHIEISARGVRWIPKTTVRGETVLLPKKSRKPIGEEGEIRKQIDGLRNRMMFATAGGAAFNLVYALTFVILWITLPSPVIYFFTMLAFSNLYEGVTALIPQETRAGRTDGAMFRGLKRREPFAELTLQVEFIQGLLKSFQYRELPRELFMDAPVVREDEPAFLALLLLRGQYLWSIGEIEAAKSELWRLEEIAEECDCLEGEIACELAFFYAVDGNAERAEDLLLSAPEERKTPTYATAEFALGKVSFIEKRLTKELYGIKQFRLDIIKNIEKSEKKSPSVGAEE